MINDDMTAMGAQHMTTAQAIPPNKSNLIHMPPAQIDAGRDLLDMPGCTFTATGLLINPGLPIDDWVELGRRLNKAGDSVGIWRGDWIIYGKNEYGKKDYESAVVRTGLKIGTLYNDVSVARAVPISLRSEILTTKHYKQVAPLKSKSKIKMWLERALTGDGKRSWSAARLKKEINKSVSPATIADEDSANYIDPHYKQLLLDYIASQNSFLNRCSYEPFKREIERTIKNAKYQLNRTPGGDYKAFLKEVDSGATTLVEIAEEVPISDNEIEKFCTRAIGCPRPTKPEDPHEAGTKYEWRPIGRQLKHGVRPRGIFLKDAPSGESFSSGYQPKTEYGDEEHY
jgi:hypothetical protein